MTAESAGTLAQNPLEAMVGEEEDGRAPVAQASERFARANEQIDPVRIASD